MDEQKSSKEPFVGSQDRPEMGLNPDTPITSLRVRDLTTLLGIVVQKSPLTEGIPQHKAAIKDFADVPVKSHMLKEVKDGKDGKDMKDYVDVHTVPIGGLAPDPTLRQTVDNLIKEVAQLREEIRQLKR